MFTETYSSNIYIMDMDVNVNFKLSFKSIYSKTG